MGAGVPAETPNFPEPRQQTLDLSFSINENLNPTKNVGFEKSVTQSFRKTQLMFISF